MKKRLRKRKKVGEYREWGREYSVTLKSDSDLETFLDEAIEKIELMGGYCGGGGESTHASLLVCVEKGTTPTDSTANHLSEWIKENPRVRCFEVGPPLEMK